jgi:hypothetical protein
MRVDPTFETKEGGLGEQPAAPPLLSEVEERTDPSSEGASRFDIPQREWQLLRSSPLVTFLLVAAADGRVLAPERRALERALEEGKRASPSELFRAICTEILRKRESLLVEVVSDALGAAQLTEVYGVVAHRLGRAEAERFKQSLMELGRRVAAAANGLFGALWLRREERLALSLLAEALEAPSA